MEVHIPDPEFTNSAHVRANFRRALRLALAFVAILWAIQYVNWGLELGLQRFGVRPREWSGLIGVFAAPLLHGGVMHLIANSLPLVVLGTAMLHLYPQASRTVLPAVWLGPGLAVWLLARESIHIGASGLVYGLFGYVFVAGIIRRDRRAIAASLLVAFMYGSLAWGVLPIERGVSWETHLAAALIGVALAAILRHRDIPPRRRYDWEGEQEQEALDEEPDDTPPYGHATLPPAEADRCDPPPDPPSRPTLH
jgi:membrane associated rhomboid family serine protease